MSRIIPIDSNTYIGYNYLIKKYFINNRNSLTYRENSTEAKKVLDIVAPDNVVSIEYLNTLAEDYEVLTSLSYTLSDTGSYISTIQINDYEEYPIELKPETNKLIIRNTNIVFDLTLNEARNTRIAIMQAYYKEHLGLNITIQELTLMYNLIISTYNPNVHNLIFDISTTPIYYSNSFACSNYSGRGKLTYECDANPYEEFSFTTVGNIINVNSSTNTITLSSTIPSSLTVNSVIQIKNATTVLDTYTYSADGIYTIQSINTTNNTIQTKEPVQGSYTYIYPQAYLITSEAYISNIDRDTSTVTLSTLVPDTIQVGDIIYISGTQQEVDGETVTCDGSYIVGSIEDSTIMLQTQPPTNYTYSSGTYPSLTKRLYTGEVQSIASTSETDVYTVTLTNTPEQTLSANTHIVITYNNTETFYEVNSISNNTITCTYLSGTLTSYSINYPLIQKQTPNTEILISITSSSDETIMPLGEFMVDNFTQCKEYIGLLEGSIIPPDSVYANLGAEVGKDDIEIAGLPDLEFKGIYSQVYTSQNT